MSTFVRVLSFGLQLVDLLEAVHAKGLVYNNIHPDNISMDADLQLGLTNFEYVTKEGQEELHPNKYDQQNFNFLSLNLLEKKKSPSFNDDVISLYYLVVYLLCGQKFIKQETYLMESSYMLAYRKKVPIEELQFLLVDHLTLYGNE